MLMNAAETRKMDQPSKALISLSFAADKSTKTGSARLTFFRKQPPENVVACAMWAPPVAVSCRLSS